MIRRRMLQAMINYCLVQATTSDINIEMFAAEDAASEKSSMEMQIAELNSLKYIVDHSTAESYKLLQV